MAAHRLRGQAERLEHDVGERLAVQGTGHGAAHPLVREGAARPVHGELRVGGLQGLADGEAAQGALLLGVPLHRLRVLLAGGLGLLGLVLVQAEGQRPREGGLRGRHGGGRAVGPVGLGGVAAGQGDPVGPGAVDLREVELAGGQRGGAFGAGHRGEDEGVELGGAAPPARVAGQRGRARLLVDGAQPEGPRGDLQGAPGPLVEALRGAGDLLGVKGAEEGAPVGVRPDEGDLDLQIRLAALDLLDPVVPGVARRPVRGVLAVQRPPLGDEVGGADLAAVAPDRLLVELVQDDLLGLPLDDLGLLQVVGVGHRPPLAVQHEQLGQDRPGDPVGGGVRVGLEGVEGARHGVHRPPQHPAVLDLVAGGGRDVLPGGGRAALVFTRAAAREQRQCKNSRGQERQGPAPSLGHGWYLRDGAWGEP